MTFIADAFRPPKPQPLPPVVTQPSSAITQPVPTAEKTPEVAQAAEDETQRLAALRRRGRKATILTSPLGATDTPTLNRPSLGAVS